jgi:hypothetical protein
VFTSETGRPLGRERISKRDCSHESHDDVHFAANSDEALIEKVRQHRDEYHQSPEPGRLPRVTTGNRHRGRSTVPPR